MAILGRKILVACALLVAPVTGAAAADFKVPPEPVIPVPAPIPIPDYSGGWYLRGDAAWSFNEDPEVHQAGVAFSNESIDDSLTLGGGFGHNFRDKIRGDITLDYRLDADVKATDPGSGSRHNAQVSSTVALVNVYYDVLGRERVTPYIGTGIGFSYNETDGQTITFDGEVTGVTGGHSNTDFAFAAMAGFSYRLRDGWLFDAGYRFLYLGDVQTGSSDIIDELRINDLKAHELRFGVRYEFR